MINFDYLGNCSLFSPELLGNRSTRFGNFVAGNVCKDSIEAIVSSEVARTLGSEIAKGVTACKNSCDYWGFCGGGAPANKFFEMGRFDVTETLFCRVHKKALVDALLSFAEGKLAP